MATGSTQPIVGLGEILWDLLPRGRQLGGAPFNFAFHCHQLGHPSVVVSRVGADQLGRDILQRLAALHLSDQYVQRDTMHPTGTVEVEIGASGQPTFTITPEVAWDYLEWQDQLGDLLGQARALCFGTLMQRTAIARQTIQRALRSAGQALVVYDVNLRQQFYSRPIVEEALHASRWVKLNDDELQVLKTLLEMSAGDASTLLAELRRRYDLELACLTRGAAGCLVQTAHEEVAVPGVQVDVVDTVGSGDAFTAGLLVSTLEGKPLRLSAEFANRLAARVATFAGGTPAMRRADLEA